MSFQKTLGVTAAGTPGGWSAFSVSSGAMDDALSDNSDSTYIYSSTTLATAKNQLAYAIFEPLDVPAGGVIEWIAPVVKERHNTGSGYITVAEMHATNGAGKHKTDWSLAQTGTAPGDGTLRTSTGAIYTSAYDGTAWSTCYDDTFTAVIAWGPSWYDSSIVITTAPRLAELDLLVSYRNRPVVTINSPSADVTDPRVAVSWEVIEDGTAVDAVPALDTRQESYRLIVVADGAIDGASVAAGDTGFNPATASAAYDTGRIYSADTAATVADHLTPGTDYWFYVMAWQPAIGSTEMASDWTGVGPFAVDPSAALPPGVTAVAAPTISVAEDTDAYALEITVTAVAPSGTEVAPSYFAVQRLDAGVWTDVPGAQRLIGSGPWVISDSSPTPGDTMSYRARGIYLASATIEVGSAWVTDTGTLTVRYEWWLKDPYQPSLNMRIDVADYSATIPKPQEIAYGAGARGATVTHQGVRLMVHKVKIRTLTATAYNGVRALLDSGRTLVLESVFGETFKVQLGDNAEVQIIRAQPIAGEVTPIRDARYLLCTFTEVER